MTQDPAPAAPAPGAVHPQDTHLRYLEPDGMVHAVRLEHKPTGHCYHEGRFDISDAEAARGYAGEAALAAFRDAEAAPGILASITEYAAGPEAAPARVAKAVAAAKASKAPGPVFDAAADLATLDAVALGKVKVELSTWRAAEKVPLNFTDLSRAIAEARKRAHRKQKEARREQQAQRRRFPGVCVSGRHLREVSDEALVALARANDPPVTYLRGGDPVRVKVDEGERHTIATLTESGFRGRLERSADFYELTPDGDEVVIPPPITVCRDLLSLDLNRELARLDQPLLPALEAVIECPSLRPDGTVLARPGYDPATRLFYAPSPDLVGLQIPARPTPRQVADAVELVREVVGDFPFEADGSEANAIGYLVTLVVRPAITGKVPIALFDKPEQGTGGSLLAEAIATIAIGRAVPMMGAPGDEEEWRKLITSILLTGTTVAVVDNVEHVLESDSLARVITCEEWSDRLLGQSKEVRLPARAVWAVTGNNVALGRNLARRCYQIRLNAKMAQPWKRDGSKFRHPNLIEWVRANRSGIVGAVLTICRAWFAGGRPPAKGLRPLGSFEGWSQTVGGILAHAKVEGFLYNLDAMHEGANEETGEWEAFLTAWESHLAGVGGVTAGEVERAVTTTPAVREALPSELAPLVERIPARGFDAETIKVSSKFRLRLAKALQKRVEMRFGDGIYVARVGQDSHTKAVRWKVMRGLRGFAGEVPTLTCGENFDVPHEAHTHAYAHGNGGG